MLEDCKKLGHCHWCCNWGAQVVEFARILALDRPNAKMVVLDVWLSCQARRSHRMVAEVAGDHTQEPVTEMAVGRLNAAVQGRIGHRQAAVRYKNAVEKMNLAGHCHMAGSTCAGSSRWQTWSELLEISRRCERE